MNLRAVILDSQTMFIQALVHYMAEHCPEVAVVGQFASASALYKAVDRGGVELVFLELNACDRDGIEVIEDLKRDHPNMKVVVLSTYAEPKFARKAMLNGADAYLLKSNNIHELSKAIYEVTNGNTYLGEGVRLSPKVVRNEADRVALNRAGVRADSYVMKQRLTRREKEILSNIAMGKNCRQIGTELYISHQTVGVHRKNIMRKLGVRNIASLIKLALERELV